MRLIYTLQCLIVSQIVNNPNLTLPIYYLAKIYDLLNIWQVDTDTWLAENQLTLAQLRDFDSNINFKTFESVITSAIDVSGQETLGLHVGQRLGVTAHGMMGYAMVNSGSLREAVELFKRFINTRTPLMSVNLIENNNKLEIKFNELYSIGSIQSTFYEALLLTLNNILLQISFGEVNILGVSFNYSAPIYEEKYRDFFQCPIEFNATSASMVISTEGLDDILKMSDPTSLQQAQQLCEEELQKIGSLDTLAGKIKELMLMSIGHFPSLQQTADRFHMSARTLHRHLKQEETSFKDIVDGVSHKLAKEYLANSTLSIQEISYLLGYMDTANFRRAFRRWQGMAPSEFREQAGKAN